LAKLTRSSLEHQSTSADHLKESCKVKNISVRMKSDKPALDNELLSSNEALVAQYLLELKDEKFFKELGLAPKSYANFNDLLGMIRTESKFQDALKNAELRGLQPVSAWGIRIEFGEDCKDTFLDTMLGESGNQKFLDGTIGGKKIGTTQVSIPHSDVLALSKHDGVGITLDPLYLQNKSQILECNINEKTNVCEDFELRLQEDL